MREQYDETEEKAVEKCPANKYHQELRRTRKTPRFLDDDDGGSDVGSDTALSAKEYFRINSYLPVIDSLVIGITYASKHINYFPCDLDFSPTYYR